MRRAVRFWVFAICAAVRRWADRGRFSLVLWDDTIDVLSIVVLPLKEDMRRGLEMATVSAL